MANFEKFRTTGTGVAIITDTPYRTMIQRIKALKIRGRRGHSRYGLAEIYQFFVAALLYERGFSTREIVAFLHDPNGLGGAIASANRGGQDRYLIVMPDDANEGEVEIVRYGTKKYFETGVLLLTHAGKHFAAFNIDAVADEVIQRIQCFVDKVPYRPVPAQKIRLDNLGRALSNKMFYAAVEK